MNWKERNISRDRESRPYHLRRKQIICHVPHCLKFLPCLQARVLSVYDHLVRFSGYSSPFLESSPHLVDHCHARLGGSYGPV
ncbi:hypothetical protein TNCV_413651 [Trichonephila clavipes]|nr:hypothetical protein TNCV_413651 [Trichonephila clavipes]